MTVPPSGHPVFTRMHASMLRRLGADIAFATGSDTVTYRAKFREADDVLNATDGVGATGSIATVWLATADAVNLAEGASFEHSGIGYRLAGERMDDGRGMSSFAVTRTHS